MENERYKFIISIIQEAGKLLLQEAGKNIEVRSKNNDIRDKVTNIDIKINDYITDRISESFVNETIYSEEASRVDVSSGSFWSIDPIDGTASFSRNIPHYAIVIAYVEKGIPFVGAIYNPVTLELFSFQKGKGAFLNDKPVHVSNISKLSLSHVFFRVGRNKKLWGWGTKAYRFLLSHANKTANFGSSALDMCFVGAGRIEACIYGNLTTIDAIAAIGFVREAGGLVVGKDGRDIARLTLDRQTVLAVNNSEILSSLMDGIASTT